MLAEFITVGLSDYLTIISMIIGTGVAVITGINIFALINLKDLKKEIKEDTQAMLSTQKEYFDSKIQERKEALEKQKKYFERDINEVKGYTFLVNAQYLYNEKKYSYSLTMCNLSIDSFRKLDSSKISDMLEVTNSFKQNILSKIEENKQNAEV